jgi:hypothetical protein
VSVPLKKLETLLEKAQLRRGLLSIGQKVDQQVDLKKSVLQTSLFYWFLCFILAFKSGCQHYMFLGKSLE